jgi:drug/metabolite transporter (DMT)-like permease
MNLQHLAIRLMVAQGVLFAVETAAVHHIGPRVPLMGLALIRAMAGLVLVTALAWHAGFAVLRTRHLPLQLLRGGVGVLYLWVMLYSFGHLPFADATAISYTQVAYISVFSLLILGETITPSRWIAAALGIAGALLIAKPAFAGWNSAYLVALIGTSLNGLGFVLNKYMQRDDTEPTTMFYTNLIAALANLPALAFTGLPDTATWAWLPAILILGPIGMYLGIIAVRHAAASMLGPYTLLRLVIGLVGAIVIFREIPDALSTVGAALILASCMLAAGIFSVPKLRSAGHHQPASW